MSSSAAKRRRLVGPDFVAELAALAARANALSACLPAQPSESERDALAALQAACSGLEAAVAGSLEQSLLLRLPSELLVRALGLGLEVRCGGSRQREREGVERRRKGRSASHAPPC